MARTVLISGYIGFDNFGDEALLYALINNLLETGFRREDITVISNNPYKTLNTYNVNSVNRWSFIDIFSAILATNAIIFIGGLFQDKTSFKSFFYYFLHLFLANTFRKQVVFFGAGIGPLNKKISRTLFDFGSKNSTFITLRDEESLDYFHSNQTAQVTVDPVWSLVGDYTFQQQIPKVNWQMPIIGVSMRNDKLLTRKFLSEVAEKLIKVIGSMKDWQILLIPCMAQEDLPVLNELYELISTKSHAQGRVVLVDNFTGFTIPQQVGILASCDVMIAMRYHALLVPLSNGKPVFGLIYDQKIRSLLDFSEQIGASFKDDLNQPWSYFWQNLEYSSQVAKHTQEKAKQLHKQNIELLKRLYNT